MKFATDAPDILIDGKPYVLEICAERAQFVRMSRQYRGIEILVSLQDAKMHRKQFVAEWHVCAWCGTWFQPGYAAALMARELGRKVYCTPLCAQGGRMN